MTTTEFLTKKDSPWDLNPATQTFTAEMSTLEGMRFITRVSSVTMVQGPTGRTAPLKNFVQHFNDEHELTHWSLIVNDFSYIIFND